MYDDLKEVEQDLVRKLIARWGLGPKAAVNLSCS
jgi:hypothetical protein